MTEKRLTKADILRGRDQGHDVYFEELEGTLTLHPLTEGEYSQVEALRSMGGKLTGKPDAAWIASDGNFDINSAMQGMDLEIDLMETGKNDSEADALAVAFSLSTDQESWTVEEVKELRPPGIVKKIAQEVIKISAVTEVRLQQIENFRDKQRGKNHSGPAPKRNTNRK